MKIVECNCIRYNLTLSELKTNHVYQTGENYYTPISKVNTAQLYLLELGSNIFIPYNDINKDIRFMEVPYNFCVGLEKHVCIQI